MFSCSGGYTWSIGESRYEQRVSDVFITFPRQRHHTAPVAHPACHQLWVGVQLAQFCDEGDLLARRLVSQDRHLISAFPEAEPLLRGVVLQAVSSAADRESVAGAYLLTFVRVLAQRLARSAFETVEPASLRYSYPVLKAIQLMRTNIGSRVSLPDLARAAGVGVSQLCRRFRDEVGQSPAQYHRRLRLDAAKQRLLAPGSSMLDTAMSCGFSSSQHMSRLFHDEFGTTPRAWRQAGNDVASHADG